MQKQKAIIHKSVIITLLLLAATLSSCEQRTVNVDTKNTEFEINGSRLEIYVIDSCEYIGRVYGGSADKLTHKGNCKFCETRNNRYPKK